MFVNGAAGAVGSVVGQLAKIAVSTGEGEHGVLITMGAGTAGIAMSATSLGSVKLRQLTL